MIALAITRDYVLVHLLHNTASVADAAHKALGEGAVVIILHPSGSVWQVENVVLKDGTLSLIPDGQTSVIEAMDRLGITDERPTTLTPITQ